MIKRAVVGDNALQRGRLAVVDGDLVAEADALVLPTVVRDAVIRFSTLP